MERRYALSVPPFVHCWIVAGIGRSAVIRAGEDPHSFRRSESLIQGEVDWINFLAEGGVSVSRAIFSKGGKLVEAIEDQQGGTFLVTAFVKAQGQAPWELWTPELYETYGQLIGRIHTLSKHYQPNQPTWKRPNWDDNIFEFVERYLPESESVAKKKYKDLCNHVNTLTKDHESYGLIHHDAHGNNYSGNRCERNGIRRGVGSRQIEAVNIWKRAHAEQVAFRTQGIDGPVERLAVYDGRVAKRVPLPRVRDRRLGSGGLLVSR
jgi:hypothetical protein